MKKTVIRSRPAKPADVAKKLGVEPARKKVLVDRAAKSVKRTSVRKASKMLQKVKAVPTNCEITAEEMGGMIRQLYNAPSPSYTYHYQYIKSFEFKPLVKGGSL